MKRLWESRFFIGVVCFIAGVLLSYLYFHKTPNHLSDERIPIGPHDQIFSDRLFDHTDQVTEEEHGDDSSLFGLGINMNRREDDRYVYYEFPMGTNDQGKTELKVEVKDGMIHVQQISKEESEHSQVSSSSEQMFSVDSNVNANRAEIIQEKDKVVVKIPKVK